MKTLLSIAAIGLLTATPALAADPDPNPKPSPTATQPAPAATSASKPTRYCVIDDAVTGTRLRKKTCQTREQWLKQGFDPLAPK